MQELQRKRQLQQQTSLAKVAPRNDTELKQHLLAEYNIIIPDTRVCAHHVTPFRAFSDAYFARNNVTVWEGSRGFAGKSYLLALLGHIEADTLGAEVTILGGSGEQSTRVIEYLQKWSSGEENIQRRTRYRSGGLVTALMASSKSARGPHPQRMRLDEVDEMELKILDAAMGQPMGTPKVAKQTVMSSTHHYAAGTFTEIKKRAEEKGWPVHEWCIAEGQLVETLRGQVAIESVTTNDEVLTRGGFKQVTHVTRMGLKPTVQISTACGQSLRCTPEHKIATQLGWVEASRLVPSLHRVVATSAALSMAAVRAYVDIFSAEGMPFSALSRPLLEQPRTALILARCDGLQMLYVDTSMVPAQMVYMPSFRNRLPRLKPSKDMGRSGGPLPVSLNFFDSIPVSLCSGPIDTKGFHTHHSITSMEPAGEAVVWDIGVESEHEFCVEDFIVHNCYKETSVEPDGWLTQEEIDSKRGEVTESMWKAEYDLQEPSPEDRAILPERVDLYFQSQLGIFDGKLGEPIEIEPPDPEAKYATGADWAKKKDYTVIDTFRVDCRPMRRVAWIRLGRMPWPMMIAKFDARVQRYPGTSCHDATGLGDVVGDYQAVNAEGVVLSGQTRSDVFTKYIAAIEGGHVVSPKIRYCEGEHRYCTNDDLGGSGHPPDSFVAGAMAYRAASIKEIEDLDDDIALDIDGYRGRG